MNMPSEVITAIKENSISDLEKMSEQIAKPNEKNLSIFDKISASYNKITHNIDRYNHEIKILRKNADKLKEEIHLKKKIANNIEPENNTEDKKQFKKKIEINNYSINEETCNSAIDHVNTIRSNISTDSKTAYDALAPLGETFYLLKIQVKYTRLLEDILELFNKKSEAKKKLHESDKIITLLEESLNVS
jgi:hypothetical protein